MTLKPELISPFLVAAAEVLRAETGSAVQRGPLALERSAVTSQEVTALVTLVGQVEGTVLFSMSSETALGLVSRMMGEEFQRLDELVQSGIGELGNVIAGRAATKLSKMGLECTISVPTLIIGHGTVISTLDFQRLMVPLETELGDIQVHLAIREC
ncbi:MAG: chemotaxis protein CheX [Anaerolineae bacterium]|jgi:chemotaxis protein CheX